MDMGMGGEHTPTKGGEGMGYILKTDPMRVLLEKEL